MRSCLLGLFICNAFFSFSQTTPIDSLQRVIVSGKKDVNTARAYINLATEYLRTDFNKAKSTSHSGIAFIKDIKTPSLLSGLYSILVSAHQNTGNIDSAKFFLVRLKDLSDKATGEESNKILANYYSTAGLFQKKLGNYKSANPYLIKAAALVEQSNNIVAAAGQFLNVGNNYKSMGDYRNALQYHLKALRLFQSKENKKGESFALQSIGLDFYELKQFQKALDYMLQSLRLKRELDDKRGIVTTIGSLGSVYLGLNDPEKAMQYSLQAVTLAKEMNLPADEARFLENIGKIYNAKNDAVNATDYFTRAKLLGKQSGDSSVVLSSDAELVMLQKKKLQDKEQKQLEQRLVVNADAQKKLGNKKEELEVYKNLSEYYAQNKQPDKAIAYLNKYYTSKDSVLNTEVQMNINKLEEQYQNEIKVAEIKLLKKDQQINQQQLKQQRYLLITAILIILLTLIGIWMLVNRYKLRQKMKELELRNSIAADLHDEVGSSLSSIHMLSQMAKQQNFNLQEDILNKVSNNAHETMEKMSDIVWMIKPTENDGISLKERMQKFIYDVCSSLNINCSFKADELDKLKLSMEQRKNLYLIFKEAINNAAKYSGTKELSVLIEMQHKNLGMNIKDFGKGFNDQVASRGNGLENMQIRAKELKGQLHILSKPEQGTELNLTFPVAN